MHILNILKKYEENGGSVDVNWFYDAEEEDIEDINSFCETLDK